MLKRIPVEQLKPGMFVHDLSCDWLSHPFMRNRFPVSDADQIVRIVEAGIRELYIDTARGIDVPEAPTADEVARGIDSTIREIAGKKPPPVRNVTAREEMARAKQVHAEAAGAVRCMMRDVRLGQQVEIDAARPLVEDITESIFRNAGALLSLCRIKDKDDYTFLHSVSVCTLMVAFARSLDFDHEAVQEAGLGGLVHDLGKAFTPDEILNKPGRLTSEEFAVIKRHPEDGHRLLVDKPGIVETALLVTLQHHERIDGSGYPKGLAAEAISRVGQMAAIVDVYDAITADRVYHKGMPPTEALRKLLEWSTFHFNPELVQAFVRCVGIYPVGSLVRLESGRLAVVVEQSAASLLTPVVRVMYDARRMRYLLPADVNLARSLGHGGGDRIVSHEAPEHWGIDAQRFL